MHRYGFLAVVLAVTLAASFGCDNRSKTEKAMDTLKEKAGAAWNKLKDLKNQGEFVEAAKKQIEASKSKLSEMMAEVEKANPEMKAKLDAQIAKLKAGISDAETAIQKAAAEPEKTWETLKAKAVEALKKAEDAVQ